jgi:DNA modification methylase
MDNWKEQTDLLTDSLWVISERDRDYGHTNTYHGNFIPQVPRQFIKRFTNPGEVVLDPFVGSGTTLIECRELERVGLGVDLQAEVVDMAKKNIFGDKEDLFRVTEPQPTLQVWQADSTSNQARKYVQDYLQSNESKVKLLMLHPPYWDIIKFSENEKDLSNADSVQSFNNLLGKVLDNFLDLLDYQGHVALVIGDKYQHSQWIPLGFYAMQELLKRESLILKSTVVKNMAGNRAKLNQENLWRYRALKGGFYVFKHEYIFLFKKVK